MAQNKVLPRRSSIINWLFGHEVIPVGKVKPSVTVEDDAEPDDSQHYRRLDFTYAVIGLCARLCSTGGPVSAQQFQVFRDLFPMENDSEVTVRRLFDEALNEPASPINYAQRVMRLFPERPKMREELFNRLLRLAASEGNISFERQQYLWLVAETFGYTRSYYRKQLSKYSVPRPKSPYDVLGVLPNASEEKIRERYRFLIREYHPDGLAAYGFTAEQIKSYEEKMAAINAAYSEILKKRKLSKV
jgi:DnaJ like chaperone protein